MWYLVENGCCTHKYPYTHAHHSKTVTFFFISVFLVDFDIQQIIIDKWNTESKWNFFSASSSHVWVGVFPLELDIWVNLTTAKLTENSLSLAVYESEIIWRTHIELRNSYAVKYLLKIVYTHEEEKKTWQTPNKCFAHLNEWTNRWASKSVYFILYVNM